LELIVATSALLAEVLPPLPPSPKLRMRLSASLDAGPLWRHVDALATLFDLDRESSARQLGRLGDDDAWREGPLPGLRLRLAKAGPECAGAYTGFLRLAPGVRFPAHEHLGPEGTLVLAGGLRQSDGRELHAGDLLWLPKGCAHDFVGLDGEDCMAAVIQRGGILFTDGE
jgi:quercetin dioxygenase-like cupin family protein